jgi:hypothetical protein
MRHGVAHNNIHILDKCAEPLGEAARREDEGERS